MALNCSFNETINVYARAEQIGNLYVTPSICVFGIISNILNLIVLSNPKLKESPYTYLTGLALADLLTLVFIFPLAASRGINCFTAPTLLFLKWLEVRLVLPVSNLCGHVSTLITIVLTVERFIFIKFPMKAGTICQPRYARVAILFVWIFVITVDSPRFVFFDDPSCEQFAPLTLNVSDVTSALNESAACSCISYLKKFPTTASARFMSIYQPYMLASFVFFNYLPLALLIIFNVALVTQVKKSNREGRRLSIQSSRGNRKRTQDEMRLTRTLVAIIFVFLAGNVLSTFSWDVIAFRLFAGSNPDAYRQTSYKIQRMTTNWLLQINYSVNFLFYCAFNHKFMTAFKRIFCRQGFRIRRYHQSTQQLGSEIPLTSTIRSSFRRMFALNSDTIISNV